MKKTILFLVVTVILIQSSAQALSWAYAFVVWEGNLYEVLQEEDLSTSEIGEAIGQVDTAADDMTGDYYGNASNYYEVGTLYYAIVGVSPEEAIAIESDNVYRKAEYRQEAAFHFMNIFIDFRFKAALLILVIGVTAFFLYRKSRKIRA